MISRAQVVEEALTWLGVPWVHQGFSKRGCDCIGLIRGVGKVTGAVEPDQDEADKYLCYSRNPDPIKMRKGLRTFFIPIPLIEAKIADILWFRLGKDPRHLGIITEPGIVIHADGVQGKVIEHRMATSRIRMPIAAFQFPLVIEDVK